jgi:ubiquinone/menaquinone biosynthesis C-methylase UbiE
VRDDRAKELTVMDINALREGLSMGGAPRMWSRVVLESLPTVRALVPPGSRVLEVGYGDGKLSCWLAKELGWSITGLDVNAGSAAAATAWAAASGLDSTRVDFRLVRPEETRAITGAYDAVFVKTVFYVASSLPEYAEWLDWVPKVLRPGGVLVNYETGRASSLMQAYRRLRGRVYTDLCLYTGEVESLYTARFDILHRRYYGGLSQFLSPVPGLYEAAAGFEAAVAARNADNCFAVALVGHPRQGRPGDGSPVKTR